jgi:flagellar biosynthesis component FlhA
MRHLLSSLVALGARVMLSVVLLSVVFEPIGTIKVLPLVCFGLTVLLLSWVLLFPNPPSDRLGGLTRSLTILSLLRLIADLAAACLLTHDFPSGPTWWLESCLHQHRGFNYLVILVLGLQLFVIRVGLCQAGCLRRVSEDFRFDVVPGKQMAIDADRHAGMIDESRARERYRDLARTQDFFCFLGRAAGFAKLDTGVSVVILAVSGWEIWHLSGQGQPAVLFHNLLSALSAISLHAALMKTLDQAVMSANMYDG